MYLRQQGSITDWRSLGKAIRTVKGLERMMYSNMLRGLGLFSQGELGDLTAVFHSLNGDDSEDRANHFPEVPTE